jgi:hypothetical protein
MAKHLGIGSEKEVLRASKKLQKHLPDMTSKADFMMSSAELMFHLAECFLSYFYEFPPEFRFESQTAPAWYKEVQRLRKVFPNRTTEI